MNNWFTNNLWLKTISLILAIVTWFYISGELNKMQSNYYPRAPIMEKP